MKSIPLEYLIEIFYVILWWKKSESCLLQFQRGNFKKALKYSLEMLQIGKLT